MGRRSPAIALFLALALLGLAGGCSHGDDPTRQELPPLQFDPEYQIVPLTMDRYLDFSVIDRTSTSYEVTWVRPGQPTEIGPRYRYFPHAYGADTLTALIDYPDQSLRHRWLIDVALPPLEVGFSPDTEVLTLIETMSVELGAAHNRPMDASCRWSLDGQLVGTDSTYVFEAAVTGPQTVRCWVTAGAETITHTWNVHVTGIADAVLPAVRDLTVARTLVFGEISVFWRTITGWYRPIDEYQVRFSHDGPITPENVEQSALLAAFESAPGQEYHTEKIVVGANEALIPGLDAWFTVVAVDADGATSVPDESPSLGIPYYMYFEGSVHDAYGNALTGVEVQDSAGGLRFTTGPDGAYRIGPYASSVTVTLVASLAGGDGQLGWHEAASAPLTFFDDPHRDFLLIPRYEVPAGCSAHRGSFMHYLRYMTTTLQVRTDRPDFRLYRWQEYPLSVYVPPEGTVGGLDFRTAALFAIGVWNDKLEEPVFSIVEDLQEADLSFRFEPGSSTRFGLTILQQPGDGSLALGAVVPEKAEIVLYGTINSQLGAELTALHEIGHVLGLLNHSPCNMVGYLMYSAPSVSIENWPEHAIHANELQAVQLIRHLPQGHEMSQYVIDLERLPSQGSGW